MINAPIAHVWSAITQPEQIKQYFFGTQVETNWQIGTPITFSGVFEGKPYLDKGTILSIQPNTHLSYSYWSGFYDLADIPENYQTVTYNLHAQGNQIEVSVSQDNIPTEKAKQHSEQGWRIILDGLKKWVEQQS